MTKPKYNEKQLAYEIDLLLIHGGLDEGERLMMHLACFLRKAEILHMSPETLMRVFHEVVEKYISVVEPKN